MLHKTKYLLASAALAACVFHPGNSFSQTTIVTETTVEAPRQTLWKRVEDSSTRTIGFIDFDVDKDGIISTNEVGTVLFELYDTDGNEIIDNLEYERRAVATIIPVEKDTVISYDFDGDGAADQVQRTSTSFMQETRLTRFDKNMNGLSPHEFTEMGFLQADVNNDKAVDLMEWRGTYIASIDKMNKDKARFN